MAFFDEWKEKWESWSLSAKAAVIAGVLLLLVGVGGLLPKKEAVEDTEVVVTTVLAEKTEESTTLEAVIFVDIKGEVKKPGVYQMNVGDRVKDALEAAGGLTEEADSQKVNLAKRLEDQMVIVVAKVGEEGAAAIPAGATSKEATKEGKVNINTATVEELKTLKGVGEKKAEAIIEYRKKNGSFKTKEDLMKVRGIGKKLFDSFQERIVTQ